MIDATELTKKFGAKLAVDNLSFSVQSGIVTGFLGPNGAGKSTTMRLILGLDRPTKGHTRVNGRSYTSAKAPMTEVGSLLEAKSVHPGRTARSHLRALAATHGIRAKRVDELIELVGLTSVANKRAGGFSLGMSQRLGLAAALLGDPETLILDEPINGLDPEGVAWVRSLVRSLAQQGRTIFISSHLMSEMAMTADHIIIIGRGKLIANAPMSDLIARSSGNMTKVRSPQAAEILAMAADGWSVHDGGDGTLTVGLDSAIIGDAAARRGWVLHELSPVQRSLEAVYMELTDSAVEFHADRIEPTEPGPAGQTTLSSGFQATTSHIPSTDAPYVPSADAPYAPTSSTSDTPYVPSTDVPYAPTPSTATPSAPTPTATPYAPTAPYSPPRSPFTAPAEVVITAPTVPPAAPAVPAAPTWAPTVSTVPAPPAPPAVPTWAPTVPTVSAPPAPPAVPTWAPTVPTVPAPPAPPAPAPPAAPGLFVHPTRPRRAWGDE